MSEKIIIVHRTADYYAKELAKALPGADITAVTEDMHASRTFPDAAKAHLDDATALITIGRWIQPEILSQFKSLKWVQCLITGTDHIEPSLEGRDVKLTNARGIHGPQMSEIAILHMMAYYRQIPRLVRNQDSQIFDRFNPRVLHGRTVVIVGVGKIAEAVAHKCKAFGMTTVGVSRSPRNVEHFDRVEPREALLSTVKEADFVVVLLPMNAENAKFIGADVFDAMRPDAALVNISRGGVVDEQALIDALKQNSIAFAGLDVFQTTPLPEDSPLWDMHNVFITPMVGGHSDRYDEAAVEVVKTNVRHFLNGAHDKMINVVND